MSSGETMCVGWCLRSCVVGTVKQGSMDMMESDEICVVGIVEQESMESDEGGWIVDTAEEEGRATFASAVLMQLVFLCRTLHSYGHSCTWYSMYMILNLIKIRSSIRSYAFCCCYTTSDCIILEDMSDLEALIVQSLNSSVPKTVRSIFCILFVYTVCLF